MRIPDGAITDRTIEIINKKSTREGNLVSSSVWYMVECAYTWDFFMMWKWERKMREKGGLFREATTSLAKIQDYDATISPSYDLMLSCNSQTFFVDCTN